MEPVKESKAAYIKSNSRKFKLTKWIIGLSTIIPVGFKLIGIGDEVTMMVLGVYVGAGGVYGIVNAVDKKWGGEG
jgi:hypothetical protein